jgi:hypothetical protein
MENKKSNAGRKPLPKKEKKVQIRFSVKTKNKTRIVKEIEPIIKKMDND